MLRAINSAPSFLAGDSLAVQKNPLTLHRKIVVVVVWVEACFLRILASGRKHNVSQITKIHVDLKESRLKQLP